MKFSEGAFIRPLRAYLINTNVNCDSRKYRPDVPDYAANPAPKITLASIEDELPDRMDVVIIDRDEKGDERMTVIGRLRE